MKKIFSLVLVSGLIFLFGCTKNWTAPIDDTSATTWQIDTEATPELQSYENKKDGFSIQFPGTRSFQEDVYGSSVMFASPTDENDKIKENIGIMKKTLSKTYTLDEYYALNKETLSAQTGYAEVENTMITVNDLEAKKVIFKSAMNDTKLQFEQIFVIKGGFVYIITYTATEATFDDYIQDLNDMIASLEIK